MHFTESSQLTFDMTEMIRTIDLYNTLDWPSLFASIVPNVLTTAIKFVPRVGDTYDGNKRP